MLVDLCVYRWNGTDVLQTHLSEEQYDHLKTVLLGYYLLDALAGDSSLAIVHSVPSKTY